MAHPLKLRLTVQFLKGCSQAPISYLVENDRPRIGQMEDSDNQKGAKPEDMRHALKGWAFLLMIMTALFGAGYALIEM
jgi:hypothetical protein